MKIKKSNLEKIIKEEIDRALEEATLRDIFGAFKSGGRFLTKGVPSAIKKANNPTLTAEQQNFVNTVLEATKITLTYTPFPVSEINIRSATLIMSGRVNIDSRTPFNFRYINKPLKINNPKRFIDDPSSREKILFEFFYSLINTAIMPYYTPAVATKIGKNMANFKNLINQTAKDLSKNTATQNDFFNRLNTALSAASTRRPTP